MIINPSDWDNDQTDDPDFWEEQFIENDYDAGDGWETCQLCRGTGKITDGESEVVCPECDGEGEYAWP